MSFIRIPYPRCEVEPRSWVTPKTTSQCKNTARFTFHGRNICWQHKAMFERSLQQISFVAPEEAERMKP